MRLKVMLLVAVLLAAATACSSGSKPSVGTVTTGPIPASSARTETAVYAPWGSGGKLTGVTATGSSCGAAGTVETSEPAVVRTGRVVLAAPLAGEEATAAVWGVSRA